MIIGKLRTNHITDPVGFETGRPVFSWTVEQAVGSRRDRTQVLIAADPEFQEILYDSGESGEVDPLAFRPDFTPAASTRYYWKVREWDDTGDWGENQAFFETPCAGIGGQWIKAPAEIRNAMFMKKFSVPGKVKSARLAITGLGLYEAYVNGRKAGDEFLTPFCNDYNHWIQFQTYDVTDLLHEGDNALGAVLGNGWFMGRFGFVRDMDRLYGDTQEWIAELTIELADGGLIRVSSDESFLAHESPYLSNSIYDGEVYDNRKEVPGFAEASADLSGPGWRQAERADDFSARLRPRLSPRLILHEAVHPAALIRTPAGENVLDFGQEMTGIISFCTDAPEGTEILLQFGEILQDGNFYNDNLRTAKEELRYICDGEEKNYRSHFTFYGFRYLKVSGISRVDPEDFTAHVLHSEMEQTGSMETDNAKINRLIRNVQWGQRGNFVDVPTDCPQRDERMGWTGDAQVFCATACFNRYTPAFYRKFMRDMLYEQGEAELAGAVPHVVPDVLGQISRNIDGRKREAGEEVQDPAPAFGSCAWGDAATVIPWTLYSFYGDSALLEEQYPCMTGWVDWMRRMDLEHCAGRHLFDWGFHFGDWLALDNYHQGSSFGGTDNTYVASAYYLYSAELTARAAEVLGRTEDAGKYRAIAQEVRTAMQEEYFTATGRLAVDTQTALVLALYFHIAPEQYRGRLIRDLRDRLDEEDVHMTTGFVGTAYLCLALSEAGLTDYAYRLLLNEDFPSWLYEVNMGATTVWERWNSVNPDGHMSDTGMNSLNHYAYGAVLEWMYRVMGGINPDEKHPGFRHFTIAPQPSAHFGSCRTSFDSPFGRIETEWKKAEKDEEQIAWKLSFCVPFDTTADFVAPSSFGDTVLRKENGKTVKLGRGDRIELGKGSYTAEILR